jgi:hypothetical protein
MTGNGEDTMTRSRYRLAPSVTVIEATQTAIGEQLQRQLPAVQEPPPEIRELIARLAALDSEKRRAAKHRVVASLPLQPALPGATPPRG